MRMRICTCCACVKRVTLSRLERKRRAEGKAVVHVVHLEVIVKVAACSGEALGFRGADQMAGRDIGRRAGGEASEVVGE